MSDTPYPTKTRLALLRAVRDGNVLEGTTEDHMTGALVPHTFLVDEPHPVRKVCARIKEAQAAGWVELPEPEVYWRLTDAGRDVLADAEYAASWLAGPEAGR